MGNLVLGRKAGQSIIITNKETNDSFALKVNSFDQINAYLTLVFTHDGSGVDCVVPLGLIQAVFGGTVILSYRSSEQLAVVLDFPRHINIARSEIVRK